MNWKIFNNKNNDLRSKLIIYEENKLQLFNGKSTTWIGKIPSSVIISAHEEKNHGEKRDN